MAGMFDVLPSQTVDTLFIILKLMYLIAIGLYVAFAFLVVRQISLMTGTLISSLSQNIKLFGYIHLLISVVVLIFAFFVL